MQMKQNPDKVDEVIRAIGGGSLTKGVTRMANHCGLLRMSVQHWVQTNHHIPEIRFDDVSYVCEQMGIEWSPDELNDKRVAMRQCLRCRDEFESWHVGNRICGRCRNNAEFEYAKAGLDEYSVGR